MATMAFRDAVLATDGLNDAYHPGLQALRSVDRQRITCARPRDLTGSVNLDAALSDALPNDPRWDYGVGVSKRQHSESVVWIEVHPASSRHIQAVLRKFSWLRQWLAGSAPLLNRMPAKFVWVASGRVAIPANTPQRRRLSASGIHFAGRHYEL